MAQPNVTNLVDFLVKEGLVSCGDNPEDRRLLVLKTTPKGKKLITGTRDSITSEMSGYPERLNAKQLLAFTDGLNPLIKMMKNAGTRVVATISQDDSHCICFQDKGNNEEIEKRN
jgi:DNA-binding MarR family transcriptional regulator